ncbi:AIR synthase related protein domain protein [Pseudonocardia dioxanivorans CB1190]|uniref:AIR synthase related protein domain protein n=1 Tax=Pseudonocardia dioxanivorans (strain ATCC 55486 / DSM 44775 / JCM 13855 / CB1190) TaxID=675635 RepID=F4CNN5_PSEUX|nr:AIR synthase related protein [Pseudonocardia dioxanivorans]AEA28333.1 AIR synthase related protein domain protein [Pseudonocardia dioxanivorans CB1190]
MTQSDTPTDARVLDELVESVLANPGLHAKADIAVVGEVLGGTDWVAGPGDDGAVLPLAPTVGSDAGVVVCGEAIFPPFVKADPRGAGFAAVLANVNDIAAMGAVPMGIVDTIATSPEAGRLALAGMRTAAGLLDVPIVGGHLTAHDGEPAISAFAVGSVTDPALALSVTRAQPGQSLVVAAATIGTMNATFPFFRAFEERGDRCAGDVRLMPRLAREGVVVAAKDISMAGLVGSLAMLLEARGLGVTVDVDAVPAPADVPLTRWFNCFPSFGFLLCVPQGREDECLAAFAGRDLSAAVVGTLDDTGELALRRGDQRRLVMQLNEFLVTGLPR